MTTGELINDFLKQKRLAVVGVSRNPRDFSRSLFREFLKEGYDAVPVNPQLQEIEGRRCFAHLGEISPPVEGALLMTSPALTEQVVRECASSGITRVWMYRAGGNGAVHPNAVAYCHQKGLRLVEGYCPFMFFARPAIFHRVHKFCMKLVGSYPA
jgi:uncharacterized protein